MKIKNLETLLSELKEREREEKNLGISSIDEAKGELLDKISQMYGISLEEVKNKYSEISYWWGYIRSLYSWWSSRVQKNYNGQIRNPWYS